MVAVITEQDRKFVRKWLNEQIDIWQSKKQDIKNQIDNYTQQDYNDKQLDQLYNKSGTEYKADIDAQLIFINANIDRLQNIKQWLNEQVI